MSNIVKPLPYSVDLSKSLDKTDLHTLFVMGDNQAHRFELEILSGSKAVDLTGATVTGYFTNFKEDTTVEVAGKVEGGKAVVVLSKPCYTLHGQFVLSIQVKSGEVEDTVFLGEGFMRRTKGETIIYDDYIVYDVNTLMAHISAMRTATDNANAATTKATNAASTANTAASNANTKAQAAQTAADAANAAAQNWSNGTAANAIQLNGKDASEYLLKSEAFTMDLLWTNASVSSNFDAQTISLDLSQYQFVMLEYYSQICGNVAGDQIGALYGSMSEIIKVGEAASLGYVHSYGGDDSLLAVRQRCVRVRTDGIVFATAKFLYLDSTFKVEESLTSCKPYRIYGIKGVAL